MGSQRVHAAAQQIALLAAGGVSPSPVDTAAETIGLLNSIVPYVSASLFAWSPIARRHELLASRGVATDVLEYLSDEHFHRCPAYRLMRQVDPRPLRWRDTPFDFRRTYPAEMVLMPAGYEEGMTTCLVTADRRYTGVLHVSFDTPKDPTDDGRDILSWLQPIIASLFDELRTPAALAGSLERGASAVALSATNEVVDLPGISAGPHLTSDSPLIRLVCELARKAPVTDRSFYWRDAKGDWHRVRALRCHRAVIVFERPTVLPHRLTPRELDVLTLVASGRSNRQIAEALVVSVATVNTHVEHVLAKLEAPTRTACAVRASREGLLRQPLSDIVAVQRRMPQHAVSIGAAAPG
jgi:DNA-binding CsgD family transcriptional regulator